MRKARKNYDWRMKIIFSLIVFGVLVVTMLIMGLLGYFVIKTEIINLHDIKTSGTLILLTFLIASVVIGTIVSFVIGRVVMREVNTVINGLNELADGNYDTTINLKGLKVARQLNESFSLLAQELKNTEELRSEFVNDYAHELKTPIVSLLGFAKLLEKGKLSKEQEKEYLAIIIEEAERLSVLASNGLNLTKIENQSILSDVVLFNLSEQLRACVLLLEKKWSDKKLDLMMDFDEYNIRANEEMLKQVWINLLDNAIKFSNEKSPLEIKIDCGAYYITVSIKNYGVEIPDVDKDKIYDRFYRSASVSKIDGNGIGLAIVKKIVALHEGTISFESRDGYTEFFVKLPKDIE